MIELKDWNDIKDQFQDSLLLRNGASIAVHGDFAYPSLLNLAAESGMLDNNLQDIFDYFDTTDFEFILKLLAEANKVNEILDIKESITFESCKLIRISLIETIRSVHPCNADVKSCLEKMANFMKDFDTILSLYYDLLVYWAMLVGNDNYGQWFKDCFLNDGLFEEDFAYLRNPHSSAEGSTLIFYPYGCLALATEPFGGEVKLSRSSELYLLDMIISKWENENYIPLFVSEGRSEQKLSAIGRNRYLNTVYYSVLSNLDSSITVYGWSFGRQDQHIIDAIGRSKPNSIAISAYTNSDDWEVSCERILTRIHQNRHLRNCEIFFFDSESSNCWIN